MPAAAIPENDIWHLVNFVRSLAKPETEEEETAPSSEDANASQDTASVHDAQRIEDDV